MPLVKCRGSLVSIAFLLSGLGRRSPILVDSRLPFWRGPPYLSLIHDLLVSKGDAAATQESLLYQYTRAAFFSAWYAGFP